MKLIGKKLGLLEAALTAVILFGITTLLYLYTSGYRLDRDTENQIDFNKTGMINVKSVPDGASVYLDGELVTATDDTVAGVEPGIHKIKIVKKGFVEWSKELEVFETLVTDITAILVSQSPRLEPLTNTGALNPSISPSLSKLAYFSKDAEESGIWVIPLSSGLNLFRSNPNIAIEDTRFTKYSNGSKIEWSPNENNLLIQGEGNIYYLINLETNTAETTSTPELIRETWAEKQARNREDLIEKLEISEDIRSLALSPKSLWAPDDKKFLYTVQNGENLEYRIYNLEKPLPVGEKTETLAFTTNINDPQPKVSWYSDSFHLVLTEGDVVNEQKGTISLIRIDGTNKTEIYNNTLMSSEVYSAPGGDKILILTSFKSGDQTDLYTVSIR